MMDYASRILPERTGFILLILKYYVCLAIVFGLYTFQSYSFSRSPTLLDAWTALPAFAPLQILNIFMLIWNMQFLKDSRS